MVTPAPTPVQAPAIRPMDEEHVRILFGLLRNMDDCVRNIERIAEQERLAARRFDGETLGRLIELRAQSHAALSDMERQCRDLLALHGAGSDLPLAAFIELCIAPRFAAEASELQTLRRALHARMAHAQSESDEAHVHLKAAFEVSRDMLQHIGMLESPTTYGPGGAT